ncbi:glycosyltransferase family 2 protein [Parvibaculum lavamentivorans]|nr:glycosyltransferase family 2 protein [Parvibaculum lavamentivorans]
MISESDVNEAKVVCGIIAFYNEKGNLEPLVEEMFSFFSGRPESLRLVLVDDGSTDGSYDVVVQLQTRFPEIALIRFSRNFGHHAALLTGIKHAKGDLFFLMDADFQDEPSMLGDLIDALTPATEIVYAIRYDRVESWRRRLAANIFWWTINAVTEHYCEPHQSVLRVFTTPVRDALAGVDDYFPFLAGLFAWTGYSYKAVSVPHNPRRYGSTKYSLTKLVGSTITSILSFTQKPLRMVAVAGFFISALALLCATGLVIAYFISPSDVPGWTSIVVVVLFSLGVQLSALGLIGEYIGRIFRQTGGRPHLIVREVRDWRSED